MIFIMSVKQFLKTKKKLVEPKEYVILDATGSDKGDLKKFSAVITVDGFDPPAKILIDNNKDNLTVELDQDKIDKLTKKYFKGKEFKTATMGAVKAIVEGFNADKSFNVFIVIKNKAYKVLGTKIEKKIKKIIDVDFDFIYTFDDLQEKSKLIKKDLSSDQIKALNKRLKKLEESIKK